MAEVLVPARATARRPSTVLTAARIAEQAGLGACLLLLVTRLSVSEFGTASLVVSFQTAAVALSDHGLGLAVLGLAPERTVRRAHLVACRRRAGSALGLSLLAGAGLLALGHAGAGTVVALCGALWASSALAFVGKSAALRVGEVDRVARTEVAGSALLVVIVVLLAHPGSAAAALVLGFVAKSVLEIVPFSGALRQTFAADGESVRPGWVFGSQALAFAIANVDYLLIGLLLGANALGLYGLAFRAASLLPMQITAVVVRVGTIGLASKSTEERAAMLDRVTRRLLLAGAVFAIAGVLASPLVGPILGQRWSDASPLMVPLFLAVPWRLLLPLVGVNAIVEGRARELCRFELARLAVMVAAVALGSLAGAQGVAVLASLATVGMTLFGMSRSQLRPAGVPRRLLVLASITGALAISIGALL